MRPAFQDIGYNRTLRLLFHDYISSLIKTIFFAALFMCIALSSQCQVRITFYGDTLKGNIKKMTEHRFEWMDTIKTVYTWDATKHLGTAIFNDGFAKWFVRYDKGGHILEESLYSYNDKLCRQSTYSYNIDGGGIESRELQYLCQQCNNLSDRLNNSASNWVAGIFVSTSLNKSEYDDTGRLIRKMKKSYSSISGSDTTTEITSYKYSDSRKIATIKKETFSTSGKDTMVETTDRKMAEIFGTKMNGKTEDYKKEYDAQGNVIKITHGTMVILWREIEYF